MFTEFKFGFNELVISPYDLSKKFGFEYDQLPEPFNHYLNAAIEDCYQLTGIRGGFSIIESFEFDIRKHSFFVEGYEFSVGKKIGQELGGAEELAFFVCTAGVGLSQKVSEFFAGEDPVLGYIYDVVGNAVVEAVGDKIMEIIRYEVKNKNQNITNRYSPGYCHWKISDQQKLFKLLNGEPCGVHLTSSSLMNPLKSISGVIGIGQHVRFRKHQCELCSLKTCLYREKDAAQVG